MDIKENIKSIINTEGIRLFAESCHGGQNYNQFPYSYHLLHVALNAIKFGFGDDQEIIQACYLHDTMEDCNIDQDDLRRVGVSEVVITIVECVTDGPGTNRKERKASMYPKCAANKKAVVVKLCDRIANVEESIKTKSKQFRMYFREQPLFKEKLYKEGELEDMWDYLDRIINTAS